MVTPRMEGKEIEGVALSQRTESTHSGDVEAAHLTVQCGCVLKGQPEFLLTGLPGVPVEGAFVLGKVSDSQRETIDTKLRHFYLTGC